MAQQLRPSGLFLAALVLALTFIPSASAQVPQGGMPQGGAIRGAIVDALTNEGLPSATVAIYVGEDFVTGTASDADGVFSIGGLRPGRYEVRISSIGYESETRSDIAVAIGAPVDLGRISLQPGTALLGEAEVAAVREQVEQRADRTVYNVGDQVVTTGGSAIETLQTLPAIEVDTEGNISLRGNQNVAIHINGRPVPVRGQFLTSLLRQIPANQVDRVEIIANPSARYEANEMGGIVNIVLKQGVSRGLSGGFTVGGGTAPSGELGGNLAYQQGRVDVNASYGFRYDSFELVGTSDRTFGINTPQTTLQTLEMGTGNRSHLLNTGLAYTLSPDFTLTLNGRVSHRGGTSDNSTFFLTGPSGNMDSRSLRTTDGDGRGFNGDIALGLKREFVPSQHELSTEVRYTHNANTDDALFTSQELDQNMDPIVGEDLSRNIVEASTDEVIGQVDYIRTMGNARLETGARASRRWIDNGIVFERLLNEQWIPDLNVTNSSLYDESVLASYVQGAYTAGAISGQVGLRMEHTDRTFTLRNTDDAFGLAQTDFFPSAFAAYTFSPGTLVRGSYSRRINRPRAQQLNPFTNQDDPLNIRRGNPTLRPEFTDSFEATFQYKYFLTLAPFYRRSTDVIRPNVSVDNEGISLFTFENLQTDESYGADITLAAALGTALRGFLSSSIYRSVTDGGNIETGLASDAIGWNARGSVQSQLRPGTNLQLFGFYRAPLEVPTGRISGFGFASLGLSQRVLNNQGTVSLRLNDVFSTSRFQWRSEAANYTFVGVRDPQIQQLNLTFNYTFGRPSSAQRRQQQPQQPQMPDEFGF
ncbi:TonB-dependent receptor [soil metagenome]